jgi:hypothetical protein
MKVRVHDNGVREYYPRSISTDFDAAGLDAVGLVISLHILWGGNVNSEATVFNCRLRHSHGRSARCCSQMLRLSKYVHCSKLNRVRHLQSRSVGGRSLSCQISKARGPLRHIGHVWAEHHKLGRRRVEEVPEDRRTCILRGRPWSMGTVHLLNLKTITSEITN